SSLSVDPSSSPHSASQPSTTAPAACTAPPYQRLNSPAILRQADRPGRSSSRPTSSALARSLKSMAQSGQLPQQGSEGARALGYCQPAIAGGFHSRVHFRVTLRDSDSPSLYRGRSYLAITAHTAHLDFAATQTVEWPAGHAR